jgi:hypothetical protein
MGATLAKSLRLFQENRSQLLSLGDILRLWNRDTFPLTCPGYGQGVPR